MKKVIEKYSLTMRIFAPLLVAFGAIGALLSFLFSVSDLFKSLSSEVIAFDKGALYMLGVGIVMLILAEAGVQRLWFNRELTDWQQVYGNIALVASFILALALPQIVHYFIVDEYMASHGYSVCEEASHQWMHARTIIYIKPTIECKKELRDLFTYDSKVTIEDFRKK